MRQISRIAQISAAIALLWVALQFVRVWVGDEGAWQLDGWIFILTLIVAGLFAVGEWYHVAPPATKTQNGWLCLYGGIILVGLTLALL